MAWTESGQYNRRITIQENIFSKDDYGGTKEIWMDFAAVWAYMKPLNGFDPYYMKQIDGKVSVNIEIRYIKGIKAGWRLIYEGKIYQIMELYDVENAHREITLICKLIEHSANAGIINVPSSNHLPQAIATTGTITSTDFSVSAGKDTHRMTHWQISEEDDPNFKNPVVDILSKSNLTSLTFAAGQLQPAKIYGVRIAYYGYAYGVSAWSYIFYFATTAGN